MIGCGTTPISPDQSQQNCWYEFRCNQTNSKWFNIMQKHAGKKFESFTFYIYFFPSICGSLSIYTILSFFIYYTCDDIIKVNHFLNYRFLHDQSICDPRIKRESTENWFEVKWLFTLNMYLFIANVYHVFILYSSIWGQK